MAEGEYTTSESGKCQFSGGQGGSVAVGVVEEVGVEEGGRGEGLGVRVLVGLEVAVLVGLEV